MKIFVSIITITLLTTLSVFGQNSNKSERDDKLTAINAEILKLYNDKRYDEALPLAIKSVALTQQIFGDKSKESANTLRSLGYIYYLKDDKKSAKKTLEDAFDVYQKLTNFDKETGSDVAKMVETIGLIKYGEKPKSAEKDFETALEWFEKYNGKDSTESLTVLAGLGNIRYLDKDYKDAAPLFRRVVEIGMNVPDLMKADTDLAFYRSQCSYRKIDKLDEFEDLQRKYKPGLSFGSRYPDGQMPVRKTETDAGGKPLPTIINAGVVNGKALSLPAPRYPAAARAQGARGVANVQVLIDENGDVISACTTSKINYLLAESAEEAAYSAKFQPTKLKGEAVRVAGAITYVFN